MFEVTFTTVKKSVGAAIHTRNHHVAEIPKQLIGHLPRIDTVGDTMMN